MNKIEKGLAITIILLFIGLALSPSINANVRIKGLVEFTTEICGLDYNKQMVKLTEQEANEKNNFDGWAQKAKLLASDGDAEDYFGYCVSIDGDYAIVSSENDDDNGGNSGSAYIFKFIDDSWVEYTKLNASDASSGDRFSWSVSIYDDYAIIGAPRNDDNGGDSGSAYIFKCEGENWNETLKIIAPDGEEGDNFGHSVDIYKDYAIVGAPNDDNKGCAYIYKRSESESWILQSKIVPSDVGIGAVAGWSVSIIENYAIIGAPYDNDYGQYSGSAFLFYRDDSTWIEYSEILDSEPSGEEYFGISVSMDDNYAIIGAELDDLEGERYGSATILKKDDTDWLYQDKIYNPAPEEYEHFGNSVSISGTNAVVAVVQSGGASAYYGAGYIFKFIDGNWTFVRKLEASDPKFLHHFGVSVSIDGDHNVLVGANGDNDNGHNAGAAYIFSKPNEYPDDPHDPYPPDSSSDISVDVNLSWNCSDPNEDDLIYDIYLDDVYPPSELVSIDQSENTYNPEELMTNTRYYWQIIAKDGYGGISYGSIWSFETIYNEPPYMPSIDGETNGKKDTEYDYTFLSSDPEGLQIWYYIDWDDGTHTGWIGPYESGDEIISSHTWEKKGTFLIRCKTKDPFGDESDWGELSVTMPKSHNWFMDWLDRFPLLQRLLEKLIR